MMKMSAEVPDALYEKTLHFVRLGAYNSTDAVIEQALRQLLESKEHELMAEYVREDIRWGLQGDDAPHR